jgi:hypothetical protein
MDLESQIAAASKAAQKEVMLAYCLSKPDVTFGQLVNEDLTSEMVDVFLTLCPADLLSNVPAAKKRGRPPGAKAATGAGAPKKRGRPPKAAAAVTAVRTEKTIPNERAAPATVPQHLVTETLQDQCRPDYSYSMPELMELTGGTQAQIRAGIRRLGVFQKEGAARATRYFIPSDGPSEAEEAGAAA